MGSERMSEEMHAEVGRFLHAHGCGVGPAPGPRVTAQTLLWWFVALLQVTVGALLIARAFQAESVVSVVSAAVAGPICLGAGLFIAWIWRRAP